MRGSRQRLLVWLSRWRVDVGTVAGVAILAFAQPTRASVAMWLPLVAVALALRTWARGHLERHQHLVRTGPYAFVRHPLYLGSFLLGLAFAGMTRIPVFVPVFFIAFVAMYLPKALREEAFLRERHPGAYAEYAGQVGAFIPRPWVRHGSPASAQRFSWRRVLRHREWKTWVGVLGLLAAMWALAGGFVHATRVERLFHPAHPAAEHHRVS